MSLPTQVTTRLPVEENNSNESDENDLEDVLNAADVLAGRDAELEGLPHNKDSKKSSCDCPKNRIVAVRQRRDQS